MPATDYCEQYCFVVTVATAATIAAAAGTPVVKVCEDNYNQKCAEADEYKQTENNVSRELYQERNKTYGKEF